MRAGSRGRFSARRLLVGRRHGEDVETMSFLRPQILLASAVLLPLVAAYTWVLRRRSRASIRYSSVELIAHAAAAAAPWRRHVPAALYLSTLCTAIFATAGPVIPLPAPTNRTAVMLTIDTSYSMSVRDIVPTRMEAAKTAAAEFVRSLPRGSKAGLVAFSTRAHLLVPATEDHDRVMRAIEDLAPDADTAIGDGLLEAVYALPGRLHPPATPTADPASGPTAGDAALVPAAVVLLSDGGSNAGTAPRDAAIIARQWNVKVYTVGVGSPAAVATRSDADAWDPVDEETLKMVARVTGGTYQRVSSSSELRKAYAALGRSIAWEWRPTEVSPLGSAAAAALLLSTVAASLFRMSPLL
jgi:Ca-activated chloride channel homolog